MIPFYSKRNQVYPVLWNGISAVEKHFANQEDWAFESGAYRALEGYLPCPKLLYSAPGLLVTAFCNYPTLLEELERQEHSEFDATPWNALATWLQQCRVEFGYLPAEGNLRNFLWDAESGTVLGLDFESFQDLSLERYGIELVAMLLEYHPTDTIVKQKAAAILAERFRLPEHDIAIARVSLQKRRQKQQRTSISGIILAGGRSSRMGQDKCALSLCGQSLLQWQIEKMRTLGIDDILISGTTAPEGTRQIEDIYPARGPLGGLHACLQQAKNPHCLVIGVDIPLIPCTVLHHLCRAHQQGVTVLAHGPHQEPLLGVYDRTLSSVIEPLIVEHGTTVRALAKYTKWSTFSYKGPVEFLHNCNTPQDYATVCETARLYAECGLPLL